MKKSFSTLVLLLSLSATPFVFTACSDNNDPKPEVINPGVELDRNNLKGTIKSGQSVVLESGVYKLTGPLIVESGGKLTIKAGVIVEATAFVGGEEIRYIGVAQGGQIFVEGTAAKPVIMTATEKAQ